jgi:hypothetical protein
VETIIDRGGLATRLSQYIRTFPPGCVAGIHKIRNRFDIVPPTTYTASAQEIVQGISKEPAATYLLEADVYRKETLERIPFATCFYSTVNGCRSEQERLGRLQSAGTMLSCAVSDISSGNFTSWHVLAPSGLYSVFFNSRLADLVKPIASLQLNRIAAVAKQALAELSPGHYTIEVVPAMEIPLNAESFGIDLADLTTGLMEVAA